MHDATVLEDEVDDTYIHTYIHTYILHSQTERDKHAHTHTFTGTPATKNTCTRTHNKYIITIKILNRGMP